MPIVVICMVDAPFRFEWLLTLPLWHIDAVKGGGVHPIAYSANPERFIGRASYNQDAEIASGSTTGVRPGQETFRGCTTSGVGG
jgi:hypothetical protein